LPGAVGPNLADRPEQKMTIEAGLAAARRRIRDHTLADETALARSLIAAAAIDDVSRTRAQESASAFIASARASAARSTLVDKFLQEYGLSTVEGVTLMRLAEALLRTPDAATADALIRDKVEAGDWAAHKGKSPFPLVNFSTRALMLTAAWLDDIEGKSAVGRAAKATKDLLDRVGEPVIRTAVAQAMKIMGEHFVLGETIENAQKRAREYAKKGYVFSYDMLGEAAHTAADAEKYFEDYRIAIDAIGRDASAGSPDASSGISVKLSALHPRYEYAKRERVLKELGERVRSLAVQAKGYGIGFNIDAEEAARLDISLDLIEALLRDDALKGWDGFGVVVQAYQRRASFVIDWLAEIARAADRRIMVRLVKGAYWDSEIKRAQVAGLETYPVFTRKVLTDVSYQACAKRLFAASDVIYPQFATHNALTVAVVREIAGPSARYEVQRLHGMGEALHDRLLEEGVRSRIYAPVGGHRELLPYLVRRLLENGANSSFVNQLFDPDLAIDAIVRDPVTEASALNILPNPSIPSPRDLFGGSRLSAKGFDDGDPLAMSNLAATMALPSAQREARSIIDGVLIDGEDSRSVNPARTDEIVARVKLASAAQVDRACMVAQGAAKTWAATPANKRAEILMKAASLLEERTVDFMRLAAREAGKTIPDAIAEVREAVEFLCYYAQECVSLSGSPLGVVACISPWNFPLAIFIGQTSAALAAGNAVVTKPAEQTPLIAFEAVRLLHEAGVPTDALQLVLGDGPSVGAPLIRHPAVGGVVFTGSTEVAKIIARGLSDAGKTDAVLIAETGGINAMIVDSTALLEQAVRDAAAAAFQSAGQRCSACRLVCVQEEVADRFNELLAGTMAELVVGDPVRLDTDVGPVIDAEAAAVINAHISEMKRTAKLIAAAPAPIDLQGCFIAPMAFEIAAPQSLTREIFGPVLHVVRFKAGKLDELLAQINASGYGLTLGLHTRIDDVMHEVASRARVGNLYINRNQIGAVVGVQPFGGEGLSGTGPKAGGPHYLSALQKRADMKGAKALSDAAPPQLPFFDQQMSKSVAAFHAWANADRRGIFLKAAASTPELADFFRTASALYAEHFERAIDLPGPTGESNTLRLKGRGPALLLGADEGKSSARQFALALASGASIIASSGFAEKVAAGLSAAGAPDELVLAFVFGDAIHEGPLLDSRIRLVVFDGDAASRARLTGILARREGPLAPLLSSKDEPWRFAVERTLTINTTAAGGDVRLLSLQE
jgi:RHH-type proline utilization regulon transcriptional repressor/proline dehydrogenase/delta 1-pyrroline-5-carboxylate dehydrogenase